MRGIGQLICCEAHGIKLWSERNQGHDSVMKGKDRESLDDINRNTLVSYFRSIELNAGDHLYTEMHLSIENKYIWDKELIVQKWIQRFSVLLILLEMSRLKGESGKFMQRTWGKAPHKAREKPEFGEKSLVVCVPLQPGQPRCRLCRDRLRACLWDLTGQVLSAFWATRDNCKLTSLWEKALESRAYRMGSQGIAGCGKIHSDLNKKHPEKQLKIAHKGKR